MGFLSPAFSKLEMAEDSCKTPAAKVFGMPIVLERADECCYKTPAAKDYGTPVVRARARAPMKRRTERLFSHIQPLPFDFSPSNFSTGCKNRLLSPAFLKLEIAEEDENRCKTPAARQCGMSVVLARAPIPKKQRPERLFSHIQPLPFNFSPNFSMRCEDRLLFPAFLKLEIAEEDDECCYKTPAAKENGIPDVLTCPLTPKNERAERFCSNIQPLPFDLSPEIFLMDCEDCVLSPAFSKLELAEREHEC